MGGTGTISDLTTSGKPLLTITNPTAPTTNVAVGAYAPGNSVESYIGADVALAATTNVAVTSVVLGAGTWLVTARCVNTTAESTPTAFEAWIGPNSASITGAYAAAFTAAGTLAGGNIDPYLVIVKTVVLAVSTTVYLNAQQSAGTGAIKAASSLGNPNVSGITAVRIA